MCPRPKVGHYMCSKFGVFLYRVCQSKGAQTASCATTTNGASGALLHYTYFFTCITLTLHHTSYVLTYSTHAHHVIGDRYVLLHESLSYYEVCYKNNSLRHVAAERGAASRQRA